MCWCVFERVLMLRSLLGFVTLFNLCWVFGMFVVLNMCLLLFVGVEGCETNFSVGRNCPRGLRYYKSPELGLNLSGS